jgi:hypothetical protein
MTSIKKEEKRLDQLAKLVPPYILAINGAVGSIVIAISNLDLSNSLAAAQIWVFILILLGIALTYIIETKWRDFGENKKANEVALFLAIMSGVLWTFALYIKLFEMDGGYFVLDSILVLSFYAIIGVYTAVIAFIPKEVVLVKDR